MEHLQLLQLQLIFHLSRYPPLQMHPPDAPGPLPATPLLTPLFLECPSPLLHPLPSTLTPTHSHLCPLLLILQISTETFTPLSSSRCSFPFIPTAPWLVCFTECFSNCNVPENHPGTLLKCGLFQKENPRVYVSNKFPGDATGPRTTRELSRHCYDSFFMHSWSPELLQGRNCTFLTLLSPPSRRGSGALQVLRSCVLCADHREEPRGRVRTLPTFLYHYISFHSFLEAAFKAAGSSM